MAELGARLEAAAEAPAPVPITLLGAAGFIVTADVRVVNPLLHVIATEFGADVGSTGIIVTAYTLPYGLFQLVYGPLGDRLGKLRVMSFAMALFAVGTAACALAPSLSLLILLRFLTGVAAAALIPLSLGTIGDSFPYAQRQAAIGRFLGAIALGAILSTSMGGIVADVLTWRAIFLVFGLVSIGVWFALWHASRGRVRQGRPDAPLGLRAFGAYRDLLLRPASRLVIVAVCLEGIFFFGAFAYLGAFLRDEFGLLYVLIGILLSGFGIGNLIYSRSAGWLVHRFGEEGLILLGGGVDCLCYLAFALLRAWVALIPVIVALGAGYYLLHSTLQTKATELAPGARGTAVSLFAFGLFLGQGIGAALFGAVVDGPGYRPAFALAAVALLLLALWFVATSRRLVRAASA